MTRLETLSLDFSRVTGAGLVHLAGLTSLTSLNLYECGPFPDAAMAHLAGLVALTDLNLLNSRLTDAGIAHLRGLTKLTHLDLRSTKVTTPASPVSPA